MGQGSIRGTVMAKRTSKRSKGRKSKNTDIKGSVWEETAKALHFSPLKKHISVDVAIVGAGIAGMTTAYLLANEGKKVAVVDDGPIGHGETAHTTAHITHALDDRYSDIEKFHGLENAQLAAESHTAAINRIERIVKEEKIKCGFERVDGYLFRDPTDTKKTLLDEIESLRRIGLGVFPVTNAPAPFETGECIKFPNQAQFHPLNYLAGLAKAVRKKKGLLFTETHAKKIEEGKVTTDKGYTIRARHVVTCTNTPVNDRLRIHTKQGAYRTYVVAARIPKNSVEKILLWDTGNHKKGHPYPYHYIRVHPFSKKDDLLIVGGEDHKTGQKNDAEKRYAILERWVKDRYPMVKKIDYRWSGQVMEPFDALAYIGRNPLDKNVFIATGDSGNGITHGTIAGMLITDLVMGRKNRWEKLYSPSRKSAKAAKYYLQENLNVAKRYLDWVKRGDVQSLEDIKPGEGAIIQHGLSKAAVYKDEKGNVSACSAVCTHAACIVQWNSEKKTFDCPCHGSRFTPQGKVINGPAIADLKPIDIEKEGGNYANERSKQKEGETI